MQLLCHDLVRTSHPLSGSMSVRSSSGDDTGNIIALNIDICSNASISTGTGVSNSLHGHVPSPEKQWAARRCTSGSSVWSCSSSMGMQPPDGCGAMQA